MSFGKMNTMIELVSTAMTTDKDGFGVCGDTVLASIRAYREGRHGTEKWANRAAFSEATDLFRFRTIPEVTITTDMEILCEGERFNITSVEDVKGRRMYLEVLAKRMVDVDGESDV